MRAVIQRVSSASVTIDGRVAGAIERGLLVLLGVAQGDTEADGEWLAQKIAALRIFEDDAGRVRVDDWEMRPEIQAAVREIWPRVTTETLAAETDIAGYRSEFLKLFGFGLPGINYEAETEPHIPML